MACQISLINVKVKNQNIPDAFCTNTLEPWLLCSPCHPKTTTMSSKVSVENNEYPRATGKPQIRHLNQLIQSKWHAL